MQLNRIHQGMSKQYLGEKALAMKTLNEDIYECIEHVKKCDVSQQYHMIPMENLDEIS